MSEPQSEQERFHQEFSAVQSERKQGALRQLVAFAIENRHWWMFPIIAVLAVVGILVALTSTGVAPFIYTLF